MKKSIFIITFFIFGKCYAQDDHFSQFYEIPLLRNPALMGMFDCDFKFSSAYRRQWYTVSTPFTTAGVNLEYNYHYNSEEPENYFTFGTQALYDKAGTSQYQNRQILPAISYHRYISTSLDILSGIMIGHVENRFSAEDLTWDQQFINGQYQPGSPRPITGLVKKGYLDVALGLGVKIYFNNSVNSYNSATAEFGIAGFHLNRPKVGYGSYIDTVGSKLYSRYVLNGSFKKEMGENASFSLYSDFSLQGGHRNFLFTANLVREVIPDLYVQGSIIYRAEDALIPVVKLFYKNFEIGASFDWNILSKLKTASQSNGGLEFTLVIRGCSTYNPLTCITVRP